MFCQFLYGVRLYNNKYNYRVSYLKNNMKFQSKRSALRNNRQQKKIKICFSD